MKDHKGDEVTYWGGNPEGTNQPSDRSELSASACSTCESLRAEVALFIAERRRLHDECQKYRVALNRIARPESWGVNPGHHVEIARRALLLGMEVDPLPEAAKVSL